MTVEKELLKELRATQKDLLSRTRQYNQVTLTNMELLQKNIALQEEVDKLKGILGE